MPMCDSSANAVFKFHGLAIVFHDARSSVCSAATFVMQHPLPSIGSDKSEGTCARTVSLSKEGRNRNKASGV